MEEFAEISATKKPNTAFVTVKASVRGQPRENFFRSDDPILLLLDLLRSTFNVSGGHLLDKYNYTALSLQSGETYNFVDFLEVTSSSSRYQVC